MSERVAVVTGGNRGLGRETCKQLARRGYAVVLAARDADKAEQAAKEVGQEAEAPDRVVPRALDVTDPSTAGSLAAFVRDRFGRLDALVNNAGVFLDSRAQPALAIEPDVIRRTFEINTLGAFSVCRALVPLLEADAGGNIVNVSSGLGGITEMGGGSPGYRLSKAALNALTRILHNELAEMGIRVNSVCPGWVRTDMGGPSAARDIEEGASGIVWAATLEPGGPSGGFFRDGEAVVW